MILEEFAVNANGLIVVLVGLMDEPIELEYLVVLKMFIYYIHSRAIIKTKGLLLTSHYNPHRSTEMKME